MNGPSEEAASRIVVGEEADGQRIDHFLARILKGVPKSHIYRILRSGEVRINGGRTGPDTRLAPGDRVRVPPVRIRQPADQGLVPTRAAQALAVLHEDDALIAIDKPAGLAVHGGSGVAHGLIEQLRALRPKARFLELAHRLDKETSGVLLIAKKRAALIELHRMLRDGEIDKRYRALVRGHWRDEKRTVRLALQKLPVTANGERKVRVDAQGQAAVTVFRRLAAWPACVPPLTLLEAELKTGRTHQIRVHLAHLGHPIAGDDKYGDFSWNKELARQGLRRMFLHAWRIDLAHPISGQRVSITAPVPEELEGYVRGVACSHPMKPVA